MLFSCPALKTTSLLGSVSLPAQWFTVLSSVLQAAMAQPCSALYWLSSSDAYRQASCCVRPAPYAASLYCSHHCCTGVFDVLCTGAIFTAANRSFCVLYANLCRPLRLVFRKAAPPLCYVDSYCSRYAGPPPVIALVFSRPTRASVLYII